MQLWTSKSWIYIPNAKKKKETWKTRLQYFRPFVIQQFIEISCTEQQTTLTNWWKAAEEQVSHSSWLYLFLLFFRGFDDSWIRFPGFSKIVEKCNAISEEWKMYKEKIEMCLKLRNLKFKAKFSSWKHPLIILK